VKSHPFHILVPKEPVNLWEKLKRLASSKRRTIKQEVMLALESHLKANGSLSDSEIRKINRGD